MFPEAYDEDHLEDLLDANDSTPDWLTAEQIGRILQYARQRADARGEDSALDNDQTECLITTNWAGFTDDWGFTDGPNQVALGICNEEVSRMKNAALFTDVEILQSDYLKSGDNRKSVAKEYVDEDYANADTGEMWIADGAQEYLAIIELSDELIHGSPTAGDAM